MTYEILIGALGFIAALAVVIRPIINLNSNIVALTASMESLKEVMNELKTRVGNHGEEIDELKEKVLRLEGRVEKLEK